MEKLTYSQALAILRSSRTSFVLSNKHVKDQGKYIFQSVSAQRHFEQLTNFIDLFEVLEQEGFDMLVARLQRKIQLINSVQTLFS